MATYIVLAQFTDQGIRNIKETIKRSEAFKKAAKEKGVTISEMYWTMGQYDIVAIAEAEKDEAVTALLLGAGALGNVRTQSLRAFTSSEMSQILGMV
jgi:uncharacterized protein with GYD domain